MDGKESPHQIISEVRRRTPPGRRLLRGWLLAGAGASLAVSASVAAGWLTVGTVEGGWVYSYGPPLTLAVLGVALAASGAALLLLQLTTRWQFRPPLLLAVWIVAGIGLQASVRTLTPETLEALFRSDSANSFYSVSRQYDPLEVLGRFNRIRARAPLHAQSNMPGKVLLLQALGAVTGRTDALPWLIVALSSLGAVPVFLFVRDVFEDTRTASFAAVLYLFVPAKLFFFPLMNTVTPAIVFACAWILVWWLKTGSPWRAGVLGAALYAMVFFEPLPLVMGALFAALCVRAYARGVIPWERLLLGCAVTAAAFVAVSEAVHLTTGFEIVRAFRQIGDHAVDFNRQAGRPYGVWVRANLTEFLFGMGICQAALFAGALIEAVRGGAWRRRLSEPIATVCLSLAAVLIATDAIGINRGEVVRLWIFLACFFQIPAAWACARLEGLVPIGIVVSTSILQACLGTALIRFAVP